MLSERVGDEESCRVNSRATKRALISQLLEDLKMRRILVCLLVIFLVLPLEVVAAGPSKKANQTAPKSAKNKPVAGKSSDKPAAQSKSDSSGKSGSSGRRTVSRAESELGQARESYARLRREDSSVTKLELWERAAAKFIKILDGRPEADVKAEVYGTLGDLYSGIFKAHQSGAALSKSLYYYERMSREFEGDERVPPKLIKLADLRRHALKDEPAAKAAYYELIDLYPSSREAAEAQRLLSGNGASSSSESSPVEVDGDTPSAEPQVADNQGIARQKTTKENGDLSSLPKAASVDVGAKGEKSPADLSAADNGRQIFVAPPVVKRPMIVIDPGHGGEEMGAVGVDGILEKDVTLAIAKLLEQLLQDRLRARTILTRRDDRTLTLAERTAIANENQADLFISIPTNASEYKTARGVETYYLDNTEDKSSLKLAERENQSLAKSGNDLAFMISDFIQGAKLDESISLSHQVQNNLTATLGRYYQDVKGLGVKKAPFYVLVGAHMPCVLVEVSFIDHPVEGARLATKRYQRLTALGIFQGMKAFFEKLAK